MRGSVVSATASAIARGRINADAIADEDIQFFLMFPRVQILRANKSPGTGEPSFTCWYPKRGAAASNDVKLERLDDIAYCNDASAIREEMLCGCHGTLMTASGERYVQEACLWGITNKVLLHLPTGCPTNHNLGMLMCT